LAALLAGCRESAAPAPTLVKERPAEPATVTRGAHFPDIPEIESVGRIAGRVRRGSAPFQRLVRYTADDVVFKDEEGTGADRLMTERTRERLARLAALVRREWPGVAVRVTEAWDENSEHGENSIHYEGRALDLTTSDQDSARLARLGGLALAAGFEWVAHEDRHIHVSVAR
jgi:hypothetical protein